MAVRLWRNDFLTMNGEGHEDIMRSVEPISAEEQTSLVNGKAVGDLTSKSPSPDEEQTSETTTDQHKEMQVEDTADSSATQSVAPVMIVYYHSDKKSWVMIEPAVGSSVTQSVASAKTLHSTEKDSGWKVSVSGPASVTVQYGNERELSDKDCFKEKTLDNGVAMDQFRTGVVIAFSRADLETELVIAISITEVVMAISRAEVVIAISRADSKTRLVGHGSVRQFYETAIEPWKHCAYHENIERQTNRKPLQYLERNDDDDASLAPSQLWQPPR